MDLDKIKPHSFVSNQSLFVELRVCAGPGQQRAADQQCVWASSSGRSLLALVSLRF